MRPARLSALIAIVVVAASVAACSSESAGWTYAPAPPITPPPSVEPSGSLEPTPAGSETPSGQPSAPPAETASPSISAAPSDPAAPSAEVTTVEVVAAQIQWETDELTVPADQGFRMRLVNNDAGVPHNVAINDAAGTQIVISETFNGVEQREFDVPALAAGEYQFVCTVHPTTMVGTLTAGG
jgi:plastocyanin